MIFETIYLKVFHFDTQKIKLKNKKGKEASSDGILLPQSKIRSKFLQRVQIEYPVFSQERLPEGSLPHLQPSVSEAQESEPMKESASSVQLKLPLLLVFFTMAGRENQVLSPSVYTEYMDRKKYIGARKSNRHYWLHIVYRDSSRLHC